MPWYYLHREFPRLGDGFWTPERVQAWNDFALWWGSGGKWGGKVPPPEVPEFVERFEG